MTKKAQESETARGRRDGQHRVARKVARTSRPRTVVSPQTSKPPRAPPTVNNCSHRKPLTNSSNPTIPHARCGVMSRILIFRSCMTVLASRRVFGPPGHRPLMFSWPCGCMLTWLASAASFRLLARLCRRHDAFRWLVGGLVINYHTLADFRVDDVDFLEQLFQHSVEVQRASKGWSISIVAQDGIRIPRRLRLVLPRSAVARP